MREVGDRWEKEREELGFEMGTGGINFKLGSITEVLHLNLVCGV